MKKATLRDLVFLAICVALSLVAKRIISPVTNGLTDFFRIPGGSAAAGFFPGRRRLRGSCGMSGTAGVEPAKNGPYAENPGSFCSREERFGSVHLA